MTLSQLRYFVEVCRWGNNITRAGEELHISQPSISNAIKDLEQEFGVLLFKRANGRLHITADGERFLLKAHELLQKADEMALTMWGAGNRKLVIGVHLPRPLPRVSGPLPGHRVRGPRARGH